MTAVQTKLLLLTMTGVTVLMVVLSTIMISSGRASDRGDVLVYRLMGKNNGLMMYDPRMGLSAPILKEKFFGGFTVNLNGDLAISVTGNGRSDIFLLNILSDSNSRMNITQTPEIDEHPLGWSLDGRYLAFQSSTSFENQRIFIWDSKTKTAINITPNDLEDEEHYYRIAWSSDGRLAFTLWYNRLYGEVGDQSEIYVWDGKATINLSQNPTGRDESPEWSEDGSLAFLSESDGEYDIYIWDGNKFINNLPDRDMYLNAVPELTVYMSYPVWTNEGHLAFVAFGSEKHAQIYVWDGSTVTNMSQNPSLHNGLARWTKDGRWAFVTFFSSEQLLYVRDTENKTILQVQGQYQPAWSPNGYLAFCDSDASSGNWILSVWNGHQIRKVAEGDDIQAQWGNDAYVPCSSG